MSKHSKLATDFYSIDSLTERINKISEVIYYYNIGINLTRIASIAGLSRPSVYRIIKINEKYVKEDALKLESKKVLSGAKREVVMKRYERHGIDISELKSYDTEDSNNPIINNANNINDSEDDSISDAISNDTSDTNDTNSSDKLDLNFSYYGLDNLSEDEKKEVFKSLINSVDDMRVKRLLHFQYKLSPEARDDKETLEMIKTLIESSPISSPDDWSNLYLSMCKKRESSLYGYTKNKNLDNMDGGENDGRE